MIEYPTERLERILSLDSLYPVCEKHDHSSPLIAALGRVWCSNIEEKILLNKDSITRPATVLVPVIPGEGHFAEVRIQEDQSYHLVLEDNDEINLGIWCDGEGRSSIAIVVNEQMRHEYYRIIAKISDRRCLSVFHGLEQEYQYNNILNSEANEKRSAIFIMMHYKMCPPCYSKWIASADSAKTNYGLSGVTSTAGYAGQQLNALKQKFGATRISWIGP